jgi:multicomponent Na+:H+ antiporter subunit G
VIGEVLGLGGAVLILLAATGILRFGEPLARMHALAKASTLGLLLVLVGAATNLRDVNDLTTVILAAVLHVVTSPPASNMVSRAVYLAAGVPGAVLDEGSARLGIERPVAQSVDDEEG